MSPLNYRRIQNGKDTGPLYLYSDSVKNILSEIADGKLTPEAYAQYRIGRKLTDKDNDQGLLANISGALHRNGLPEEKEGKKLEANEILESLKNLSELSKVREPMVQTPLPTAQKIISPLEPVEPAAPTESIEIPKVLAKKVEEEFEQILEGLKESAEIPAVTKEKMELFKNNELNEIKKKFGDDVVNKFADQFNKFESDFQEIIKDLPSTTSAPVAPVSEPASASAPTATPIAAETAEVTSPTEAKRKPMIGLLKKQTK